jgi:hyperosmotically inducible periplasmic protein
MTPQKLFGWLGAVAIATTMTAGCSQTDAGITTAVKSKMAADDTVKANRIDVDTKDSVVTLKGEVQSEIARNRAIEIAKTTNGVRDVVDTLVVVPAAAATTGVDDRQRKPDAAPESTTAVGDAGITSAVKTKMLADTKVAGLKIDVDTTDGVVTLTGNVSSAAEKRHAVDIARKTDGVKSVKDQLKVAK